MPGRGRASFTKRQRERSRQDKQHEKAERKAQRKLEKQASSPEDSASSHDFASVAEQWTLPNSNHNDEEETA